MVNHSNIDTLHVKCTCTDIVKVSTRFKRWGAGLGRGPVKLRGGEKQSSRGSGPTAAPTPGSRLGSMNTVSMSLYDALPARPPAFQRSPGAGREEYFSGLEEPRALGSPPPATKPQGTNGASGKVALGGETHRRAGLC